MTQLSRRPRTRLSVTAAATAAIGAAILATTLTASAAGSVTSVAPPPAAPTSASQIQNIDQVKTAIKAYYGDTPTAGYDPVTGAATTLHYPSPTGAYAAEMQQIVTRAETYLASPNPMKPKTKAVLFDIDDTLLNTYNYEIYSNFVYNPTQNAAFVNSASFPAVFHMVELEHYAESKGYRVFFLTGRPEAQRAGTIANLTDVGYDVNSPNLFLKDLTNPIYASCAPTCSTIQYKSLTRAYIESQGNVIVANFGDQYSDLTGGYARQTFKLPNPMYFLP